MMPGVKLNASFAAHMPRARQSRAHLAIRRDRCRHGGLGRAEVGVGFSGIVSIGDQLDVDIADLLDYFALDRDTGAILLYIEAVRDARKFMSAARAAARIKPIVVVKSGREWRKARARPRLHTGALAGADDVYDAAFRRAGMLRVFDLRELFDCAETLGRIAAAAWQAACHADQWRRPRRAGDRPLVELGGTAGDALGRDTARARCRASADLVPRQSGRHRRRCRRGALCGGAGVAARRPRQSMRCWS